MSMEAFEIALIRRGFENVGEPDDRTWTLGDGDIEIRLHGNPGRASLKLMLQDVDRVIGSN